MALLEEGRKERRTVAVEGAIDGCQTAFQASYPYREANRSRLLPRKDIIPLGRGWVGRSTMVDWATGMEREDGGEEEGGEEGNAKRSWPGRLPRFTNYSISPAN